MVYPKLVGEVAEGYANAGLTVVEIWQKLVSDNELKKETGGYSNGEALDAANDAIEWKKTIMRHEKEKVRGHHKKNVLEVQFEPYKGKEFKHIRKMYEFEAEQD